MNQDAYIQEVLQDADMMPSAEDALALLDGNIRKFKQAWFAKQMEVMTGQISEEERERAQKACRELREGVRAWQKARAVLKIRQESEEGKDAATPPDPEADLNGVLPEPDPVLAAVPAPDMGDEEES